MRKMSTHRRETLTEMQRIFFSSRRRHTRCSRDWSSDVCSSDLAGVTQEVMRQALQQAREARFQVLEEMSRAISEPRDSLSPYAPRIITIRVPVDKIREVIGPGGKVIRGIIDEPGGKMDVSDDGA